MARVLRELANALRKCGGAFTKGEGSVWGLSCFDDLSKKEREPLQRNWVRYYHTPDIWEDDTAEFWRAKVSAPSQPSDVAAVKPVIDNDNNNNTTTTDDEIPDLIDFSEPSAERSPLVATPVPFDISGKTVPSLLDSPVPGLESSPGAPAIKSEQPALALAAKEPPLPTYTPIPWNEGATLERIGAIVAKRNAFAALLQAWCDIISKSTRLIDVTSLEVPAPGSQVAKDIIAAIATAVSHKKDNEPLAVRLFFGGTPQSDTAGFKTALERALYGKVHKDTHVLFGCDFRGVALRSWKFFGKSKTWNHSKIVAGDGWRAITGGHNMNAEASYTQAPVIHDLSVEVVGHGAQLAHDFATSLWDKGHLTEFVDGYCYDAAKQAFVAIKDSDLTAGRRAINAVRQYRADPMNQPKPTGDAYAEAEAVMGVGRWGDVEVNKVAGGGVAAGAPIPASHGFHYCSDHVKRLLIAGARRSICISQQDLVNGAWTGVLGYPEGSHDGCHALGKRLAQPGPIEISVVVSGRYALDSGANPYSYGNSPREARDLIAKFAGKKIPEGNVCTVAPLVFCRAAGATRKNYIWPDAWRGIKGFIQGHVMQSHQDLVTKGFGPGNHAKAMMIDDEIVLIGSDNMYPSPLAEFSFLVEGHDAAAKYREVYWSKLWKYSRRMGLKIDHSLKVDTVDPHADFAAIQKSAAADRKVLAEKLKRGQGGSLKLVQAVSALEQIEKAGSLDACYRALRFLPPGADLKKISSDEMHDFVYGEYLDASVAASKGPAVSLPSVVIKPWKEVRGVKLTMSHKEMLASEHEWLDDRAIDAYVSALEGAGLQRRFDVPVGRFVAAGGAVPVALTGIRGVLREVQVLNINGNHWILAVRFPVENQHAAYVYDSLGTQTDGLNSAVVTHVRRCFHLRGGDSVKRLAGPRQPQSWECGPYACAAIELLSRTEPTGDAARAALAIANFDNRTMRQAMSNAIGD